MMAFGNYAPFGRMGYYPMPTNGVEQQNQFTAPYIPQQIPTSDTLWVLNEAEATCYPVAPNNSVVLWDKSNPTIYVKSVNAQGVPFMRILDFVERKPEQPTQKETEQKHQCACKDKFITIEEFTDLKEQFIALKESIASATEPAEKPKTTKKAKEGDE